MKFGLMIMARGPGGTGAGLGAMARAAEAGGLDFLAFNDHVVVPRSISSKYPYSNCLLYTSPSPRDLSTSRMPSSA